MAKRDVTLCRYFSRRSTEVAHCSFTDIYNPPQPASVAMAATMPTQKREKAAAFDALLDGTRER